MEALIERNYIIEDELLSTPRSIKEIWITEKNNIKIFGMFLKDHVDNKPIRLDIRQAINTLKHLLVKFDIKSVEIRKDLGMLSMSEWNFVIEQIMLISDTPTRPFSKISIDFVGPKELTEAGNRYILTILDSFSKFCILVPTHHATAEEVTHALLEKFICYFGSPVTLISNQETHFINAILQEFARIFKINKFSTTAYHPQFNGRIERMHHTLNEYLKQY